MNELMVDSDVLIDYQRGHAGASAWFAGLTDPLTVVGFVVMELIQDARNRTEVRKALKLTSGLSIVWPPEADCQVKLALYSTLHLSHGLGLIDALIAATAVGRSATLCTFNVKHFRAVPGLVTLQPYTR